MNRRSFLATLTTATAALTLDPERLLWVPGAKTIFIPPPPRIIAPVGVWNGCLITWDDIVEGSEGPLVQFGSSTHRMVTLKPDVRMFGADDSMLVGGPGQVWLQVHGSAIIKAVYSTTGRFGEHRMG